MKPDFTEIEKRALKKEKENWRFRSFLKFNCELPDNTLDKLVPEITDRVWATIDCTSCGRCCKVLRPYFSKAEQQRPEFINRQVKKFLADSGVDTLYIEPGSPWENGYAESFNSKFRDELLNGELFLHIDELRYVVERWRMDYNHYRPHSSLSYMTPAEFAKLCVNVGCVRTPKEAKLQEILSQRLD